MIPGLPPGLEVVKPTADQIAAWQAREASPPPTCDVDGCNRPATHVARTKVMGYACWLCDGCAHMMAETLGTEIGPMKSWEGTSAEKN